MIYCAPDVLPAVENAEHLDYGGSGLVIVDDVLLNIDAAAPREEIILTSAKLRVIAQQVKCTDNFRFVCCALLCAPGAL